MKNLSQDLLFAFRLLRTNLGFTAVAVLTLALGIAVNTTVFTWLHTVMLTPFPGVNGTSELALLETVTSNGEVLAQSSFIDYKDYRDYLTSAAGVAASRNVATYMGRQGELERVFTELVTRDFFDVLQVKPQLGRTFRAIDCDEQLSTCPLTVISHGLWQRHFQGDPAVVGKTIQVGRQEFTVVGVAPKEFCGSLTGLRMDMWVPINWAPALGTGGGTLRWRATRDLTATFIRLKPGVSIQQANQEAGVLASRLAEAYPKTNRGIGLRVVSLQDGNVGAQRLLRGPLHILTVVSLGVLLLVSANVANLLLARLISRRKEITIRMALGAGRWQMARQFLVETLMLAGLGAVGGALLSLWFGQALVKMLPITDDALPLALDAGVNPRTLFFSLLGGVAATVLSGTLPALLASRSNLNDALKASGRGNSGAASTHRLRGLLVVSQVALACLAIVGAGLFAQSFRNASRINPGFETAGIVSGNFNLSPAGYSGKEQRALCRTLRESLEKVPGIAGVTYTDYVPLNLNMSPWNQVTVEGYTPAKGEDMTLHRSLVPPGYFDLLRIPIVLGRDFSDADDEKSLPVMIVNQEFARRYFGSTEAALGRKVLLDRGWRTITGIVKTTSYFHPVEPPRPYFFMPFAQYFEPGLNFSFLVKSKGDLGMALEALRREARALNPDAVVYNALPLGEATQAALYPQRVAASMMSVLGALCLLLASIGLYSVMSYAVSQRTGEMGLRMALGAAPYNLIGMILRQGFKLVLPGLVLGVLMGLILSRLLSSFLIQVAGADPLTYAGAALFLSVCAAAACFVPAIRATRVNPVSALRTE